MRPYSRPAIAILVVCAIVAGWTDRRLSAAMPWRYPAVNELVVTEHYLTDIGALLIGARRLAADIAYIQFLQYYGFSGNAGTGEAAKGRPDGDHSHDGHDHGDDHDTDPGPLSQVQRLRQHDMSAGLYIRLQELATRILRLDPYFNAVILEAAGALAFNQKRTDEALHLLREAIIRDPSFYRYHLYVSAILYKEKGDDAGMVGLLMEAIKYPDCPPLLELVLGNLLKSLGRPLDAARVYLHTHLTAAQEHDREDALRRLKSTLAEHPEIAPRIASELPAQ